MIEINLKNKPFGLSIRPFHNHEDVAQMQRSLNDELRSLQMELRRRTGSYPFARGTSFKNLETVLSTGVDVIPSNAPFFCSNFVEKSLEYGWEDNVEPPKALVLFYDHKYLKRSFVEIPSDAPKDELDSIREQYPTFLTSTDGSYIWASRFPNNDTRLATPYESEYGYWIPENPFDALKWVVCCGSFAEEEIQVLKKEIENK